MTVLVGGGQRDTLGHQRGPGAPPLLSPRRSRLLPFPVLPKLRSQIAQRSGNILKLSSTAKCLRLGQFCSRDSGPSGRFEGTSRDLAAGLEVHRSLHEISGGSALRDSLVDTVKF